VAWSTADELFATSLGWYVIRPIDNSNIQIEKLAEWNTPKWSNSSGSGGDIMGSFPGNTEYNVLISSTD